MIISIYHPTHDLYLSITQHMLMRMGLGWRRDTQPAEHMPPLEKQSAMLSHMVPATAANPLGRASMAAPTEQQLRRASVVSPLASRSAR